MTSIAQAVVTVRPDLKGFAAQLRKDVEKQIDQVGVKARTITINAQLASGTAASLQTQLNKIAGLTIKVTPTITAKDKAALQAAIGTVPIKVSLKQATGSAGARAIEESITKAGGTTARNFQLVRDGLPGVGKEVPDQSLAILAARKRLEVETKDLSVAEADLARAKALSEKADARALQLAQRQAGARAQLATAVAADAKNVVALAEARVAGISAEAAAQTEQAASAAIAEQAMVVLAQSNTATTITSEKQAKAAIAVADALDKQRAAALALAKAQLSGASAQTLAPLERDVARAGLNVQAQEAKAREVAAAEAAAINAPVLAAQQVAAENAARLATASVAADTASIAAKDALQKKILSVADATQAVALAETAQLAEEKALAVAIETQSEGAIRLRTTTKAGADEALASARARLTVTTAQIEAENLLAAATVKAAESETVAGRRGLVGIPAARAGATLAGEAAGLAGDAAAAAQVAGNAALEREALLLQANNALREDELRKVIATTAASKERLPIEAAIARIQKQIAITEDTSESLLVRKRAAINADRLAATALTNFSRATINATEADFAFVGSLEAKAAAQLVAINADLAAAVAADKAAAAVAREATVFSQAQRGALGTGATFLGLRGAILSASGGFLAATIAVTALAKTIGTASDLQRSLNVFQAVAGATADQMARVSAEAKKLGADLTLPATSANDAAAAMTELARAGLSVDNSINAARGVLQLAAAANIQVGESATIVATQLNAFGLAGEEATRVADLLTGAAKSAQGEIGDFALAFQQVAAVANQVQLPLETTTAILTQFAKAGLRGSDAGTSLRTLLLRLVPTSKAAADAQQELGIRINDSLPIGQQFLDLVNQYTLALAKLSPVAQQESLTKIFGQDAIRGASISLTEGSTALVKIQADVSQAGLAAEQSAARMKGLSGAVEGLKSAIETFAGTIGSTTLPSLEAITRELAQIVTTADAAVQALQKLGDVGIGPVTPNAVTGALADPLASVGLAAAAALGAKKLASLNAERKARKLGEVEAVAGAATVAKAEVAAAAVTQGAWTKTAGGVIVATNVQTAAQVAGARTVSAANIRAAAASSLAWVKASASIKGLAAGTALAIAGDLLGSGAEPGSARGNIGGTLSGAGQGAVIGTIIAPGLGTAIGAGVGALFGAVTTAVSARKAQKAKWDALSAEEQWTWFLEQEQKQPGAGSELLALFGFTLKANPFTARAQQAIPDFQGPQTLVGVTRAIVQPQTGVASFTTDFVDAAGGPLSDFLKKAAETTKKNIAQFKENAGLQAQLALATAELNGDTVAADAALDVLVAENQKQINRLNKALSARVGLSRFVLEGKDRNKALEELIEVTNETATLMGQYSDATFSLSTSVQLANINAGATEGLADNLAAQQDALAEIDKALANAIKRDADQESIDALKIQQAQQRATVTGTNQSIQQQAEAEAKQRVTNQQTLLRIAADAAGNIGAAENRYIEFLKAQTTKAGQTTAEQIAAVEAYKAEIEKRRNALQGLVDATVGLRDAKLSTKLAQADLTETNADNIKIFRQQIKNDEADIKRIKIQAAMAGKTQAERVAYLTQIQTELQDIARLKGQIKNAKNQDSGATPEDFFRAAVENFRSFGGGTSGIFSPQGARGDLAGRVLDSPSGGRSGVGSAIKQVAASQARRDALRLAEARRQTALLRVMVNRGGRRAPLGNAVKVAQSATDIQRQRYPHTV